MAKNYWNRSDIGFKYFAMKLNSLIFDTARIKAVIVIASDYMNFFTNETIKKIDRIFADVPKDIKFILGVSCQIVDTVNKCFIIFFNGFKPSILHDEISIVIIMRVGNKILQDVLLFEPSQN